MEGQGRGKRTTVARLTFKGVLEAVRIFPDYTPDFRLLIAETDLRAMLAQAAVDHTPLALQVARDRADAEAWRRHEARRKEASRAAEAKRAAREKPAPKQPSAGRNRSEEDLEARREWAAGKWPQRDETVAESELRRESGILDPLPPVPTPAVTHGGFCERCHMNTEYCRCQNPIPGRSDRPYYSPATGVQSTAQDSPSDSDLAARIRKAGHTVRDGRVQHGFDRWIPIAEWMAKEGWRLQA